jgi:hypothetical protein
VKYLNAIAVVLALTIATVCVLVVELPRLMLPITALFLMLVIGRLVWFYTQRW